MQDLIVDVTAWQCYITGRDDTWHCLLQFLPRSSLYWAVVKTVIRTSWTWKVVQNNMQCMKAWWLDWFPSTVWCDPDKHFLKKISIVIFFLNKNVSVWVGYNQFWRDRKLRSRKSEGWEDVGNNSWSWKIFIKENKNLSLLDGNRLKFFEIISRKQKRRRRCRNSHHYQLSSMSCDTTVHWWWWYEGGERWGGHPTCRKYRRHSARDAFSQ